MFIDDLIEEMMQGHHTRPLAADDHSFLASIHMRMRRQQAFTTRQCFKIKSVLGKYVPMENGRGQHVLCPSMTSLAFGKVLRSDAWRLPPSVSVEKRSEARYLGDNIVALSYTQKADMTLAIPALRQHRRGDLWIVAVTDRTLDPLIDFLGRFSFEIDDALEAYLALCLDCRKQMSHFIVQDGDLICAVRDCESAAAFLQHIVGATRL